MASNNTFFWVVDGSSIEYLDLRICEFQRERIPRVISSLDLSLRSTPPTASYVPLIPVFRTKSGRMSVIYPEWTATVFFDVSRSILQKLELDWDEDTAKLYVSHLRAFCGYVGSSFYSAACFRTNSILSQLSYKSFPRTRLNFINSLKLEATRKLVRILFGKVRLDSGVIMDILEPICSWKKLAQFSLKSDPAITDSILSHLQRNKRWVTTEELIKFFSSDKTNMIRARPKNLLLFLNYGFKNVYNPVSCYTFLYRMISLARNTKPCFRKIRYAILQCFMRGMTMDKREAMILETCALFLGSNERNLSKYIESMCYIWRSIPNAYITLEEIKHTLFKFLPIETDESVEEVCHELQRRGFNGFQHKQETNSAQTREEPESEMEDSWFANLYLPEESDDSPDDRVSTHNIFEDEKPYSRDSNIQLLEEQFYTNSRLSKNPESLISLPRGLFLPYSFSPSQRFLASANLKLMLLTRAAESLINSDNSTIQPHSPFAHNLGAAEEVFDGTSQSSEYSREAVRHSKTQNSQWTGDFLPHNLASPEEVLASTSQRSKAPRNPIRGPRNPLQNFRKAVRHSKTQNSQRTGDFIPHNLASAEEVLASTSQRSKAPRNPIRGPRNPLQNFRKAVRHSKIQNSQWTGDFIPHNLASAEEVLLASTSQRSEKPHRRIRGPRNLLQNSREAVRHSVTQNPQLIRDFVRPKKGKSEDLIHEPENKFHYSREAVRHSKTQNSQWTRDSIPQNLGSAEEVLASTSQCSEEPRDPIRGKRNPFQYSREAIRHSKTQNSHWTRDSITHNLGAAEEVLAHPSQGSEEPHDPFHEARNPLQYSREANSHSATQNPQWIRDSIRPNQEKPEIIFPEPGNTLQYSRGSVRGFLAPNSQRIGHSVAETGEEPNDKIRNASNPSSMKELDNQIDLPNLSDDSINAHILNPLYGIKNRMHELRNMVRELLIRNIQRTEDSVPQAREQQPEGRVRNTSISSSDLPEEADNPMNPQILFPDSRTASCRNARDSNFQLPDERFRVTPPTRNQFSYSQEAMRYGANYDPCFPEEIEYHQNTNSQPSQAPEHLEIPFSRARNIDESRIKTVMARILTMPELSNFKLGPIPLGNIEITIKNSLIRILQWKEEFAKPCIPNLQLREEPANSNIQMSGPFFRNPRARRESPNSNSQFPREFMEFIISHAERMAEVLQHAEDPQTRESQYLEVPDHAGPEPRRLLHYTRCVIRDALIVNSQLPQGITLLKLPDRLQSYLKLEL